MMNLFQLKYVLNKKLLKIFIGKVDAQLFKAAQHNIPNAHITDTVTPSSPHSCSHYHTASKFST